MKTLQIAAALFVALTQLPGNAPGIPPEGDELAKELAAVANYAFGGVGFAGTISKGETLYKRVLAVKEPESVFLKVYATGSPAAKAYALCGLRTIDSDRYPALRDEFVAEKFQVSHFAGCIMSRISPEQTIALIEKRGKAKD